MGTQMRRATRNLVLLSILALVLEGGLLLTELLDRFSSSSAYAEPTPSHVGYPEAPSELNTIPEGDMKPVKQEVAARVAIVIDDFGYQWPQDHVQGFVNSEFPVTLAIIPGAWASERTAKAASKNGHEIILHVPMEPDHEDNHTEENMLRSSMTEEEARAYLDWAFASIPQAVGLNNHMGSGATQDPDLMNWLAAYCYDNGQWN